MQTLEDLTKRNPQSILATYLVGSLAYLSTVEPVTQLADERFETLHETFQRSTLPEDVDRKMIDTILHEITAEWEKDHAAS